jgi:hypothetical protein
MKQQLFQVHVTSQNTQIPIGPKFSTKPAAEQLAYMTNKAVAEGRIHGWADATVVTLIPTEH